MHAAAWLHTVAWLHWHSCGSALNGMLLLALHALWLSQGSYMVLTETVALEVGYLMQHTPWQPHKMTEVA